MPNPDKPEPKSRCARPPKPLHRKQESWGLSPKIPVAILGATGAVGQRFVQLLAGHPWFEIAALAASERSAGHPYAEACNWVISGDPPPAVAGMTVRPCLPMIFPASPGPTLRFKIIVCPLA